MKKIYLFLAAICIALFIPQFLVSATAEVTDLRWAARNDGKPPFVRLTLDLSQKVTAVAALDEAGENLELVLKNTQKGSQVKDQYDIKTQNADFVTAVNDGDAMRLDAKLARPMKMADIKIFALKPDAAAQKPHRLVIDISSVSTASAKKAETPAKDAPSSYTADRRARQALKGKIICIDPGHGGADVGAIGRLDKKTVYEKDITLSIAKPLRDILKAAGAKVVMTRETDKDVAAPGADAAVELQARCDIANKAKADVFISLHIDSFSNTAVDGTTAYYAPKTGKDLLLAQMLHQSMMDQLAIPDRGVRSNDFYVNVHSKMPSVLMEMGFLSNTHRLKMLTSSWGPKSIAQSLADGLVNYFERID